MRTSTVFDRLQNLINYKPSQKEIAEVLGVTQAGIGNRVARDSEFPEKDILLLEQHYGVDIYTNGVDSIELDYFTDTFASCGTGVLAFSNTKDKIKLTKDNIKGYNENKKYSVINAYGVSMQPYIQDMDKLIVEHWDIPQQIIDNRIYVFLYKDELFVKRLAKNIDDVVITSDNPRFDDKIVKADEDLQIIGQIVGILRDVR